LKFKNNTRKEKKVNSHKSNRKSLIAAVCSFAAILIVVQSVAANDTFKQSAELGKRTAKTSDDIDKFVAQLDKTEQAISSVQEAQGKELKKRFESFAKELSKLDEAQKHATSDINEMNSTGAEYFSSWDTSIAQMANPDLKQASAERRSKVMKDHDDLDGVLSDLDHQLQPFMNNIHDLKTFLETDLSPANISKAAGMIQRSHTDAQALRDKISGVQSTLKQFLSEAPK
jgi:Protein of unknown function (DUF2959)